MNTQTKDLAPIRTTEGFSDTSHQMTAQETSSSAAAAQAKAAVEARYIMALRNPRDMDAVRTALLHECKRPTFAAVARYRKPIGAGVEGLSIRFVETALRCMRNVDVSVMAIYDDATKKIVRISVADLENNIPYSQDVTINKTVERSKPLDDGTYISVRSNSSGKKTYTLPATDDDMLNKEGALISKAIRTLGLRLIPGDLQDEAEALIIRTAKDRAAADPDAERKAISDGFATLKVTPEMLADYLGQPLAQVTPAQLADLRVLFTTLRDGETTWKAVMDNKAEGGPKKPGALPAYPDDKLQANLTAWTALVTAGTKTPDAIITMVKSKHTLTAEQETKIKALATPATSASANVDADTGEWLAAYEKEGAQS